jgi:hypothetical protein
LWRSPLIVIPLGAAVFVGMILFIALALSIASLGQGSSACSGGSSAPAGSVSGIPSPFLPYFEGAGAYFQLGPDGWAYLAALNYAESSFGTDTSGGSGVTEGSNFAGAAGPMQIGIGGAASDNWDTYKLEIPANLLGGAEPPSVYNEADAVYAAAAKLKADGAPTNWTAALIAWNDYPPEIQEVTRLVAQYTQTAASGVPPISAAALVTPGPLDAAGCAPVSGPTVAGAAAQILPDGTAAIPSGAPAAVQAAIAAGNEIIHTFYSQERRANMLTQVQDSYDCSGSVDWVLANAGLGSPQVDVGSGVAGDSALLESYGVQGPGQWITVFGSGPHAFLEVAGIVLDTAQYAPVQPASVPDPYPPGDPSNGGPASGPRWQPASIVPAQLNDGNAWFERHPIGL